MVNLYSSGGRVSKSMDPKQLVLAMDEIVCSFPQTEHRIDF
jgi:hypothetical protein